MNLPSFGLRAGILAQLIFLIIAAMLLVNVAMLDFYKRDLIKAKVETGKVLIQALGQNTRRLTEYRQGLSKELELDAGFKRDVSELLSNAGFSGITLVDHNGDPAFTANLSAEKARLSLTLARAAMGGTEPSVTYHGIAWGVLWLDKREMNISSPLLFNGKSLGGITIAASLLPTYRLIRESEKLVLLYIVLDAIILALVGIYLLSRIVVKPIYRLLRMTEGYKDGDMIPPLQGAPRNEIGDLSRSLSIMLHRLDDNKKELKRHISSLEEANRKLRDAQKEIIRSEKLASVGRLAAGIAHEIGNPIGIILGYLQLLREEHITDQEREDFIKRVETEITRVNRIISQLLDFSRPSSGKKEENGVHELIMDTINMLKPQSVMSKIEVNPQFRASSDRVTADPGQLRQVFLNIILNAADALAGDQIKKGQAREINIATDNLENSLIEIRFTDNGPGMDEKELIHIFDPFFTTKEPGRGTGLGLSVCYRIVEEYGGEIMAESAPGKGMTIIVDLPLYRKETEETTDERVR